MPPAFREKLQKLLDQIDFICERLNRSQKYYLIGAVLGLFAALGYLTRTPEIFLAAMFVSGAFLAFGVISDLLIIYKSVWETMLGKGVILLLYGLSTNTAYAAALRTVNELVKFETSGLTYTVNFVAILLAPAFIFIGVSVVFMMVLIFGQFYFLLVFAPEQLKNSKCIGHLFPQPKESYPKIMLAVRFIAFPVVIGLIWTAGQKTGPNYGAFVNKSAAAFIFNFEAAHYSRCELDLNTRAIKVNDNEIVVVSRSGDEYKFEPKKCVPIIRL
jgi:hypothetical protein